MSSKIKQFCESLQNEIPGFVGFAIGEVRTGKCVFSQVANDDFDMAYRTVCNVDFIRAKINALRNTGTNEQIENIIVNLETQFHVFDLTPDNQFFFYIVVNKNKTNLAIVIKKLAKCKDLMN